MFQVYFKRSLGSLELDCLPEYCRTLLSPSNDNDLATIIKAGLNNYVFAHTNPQPIPELEGFRIPFTSPANSVLHGEQINQSLGHPFQIRGGYTIAGIIIQEENMLLPCTYHENCQQVSSFLCSIFLVLFYTVRYDFRNVYSNSL